MQIPIYVISLIDAVERRQSITRQLEDLKLRYEIIDAVDGRLPDFLSTYEESIDQEWDKKRKGEPLSLSEKACALSHVTIYDHLVRHNIPEAIILEDDAILMPDFHEFAMKRFLPQAYQQLTILHIYTQQYATKEVDEINEKYSLYQPYRKFLGTCAYYIGLSDAEALYRAALPIWVTSDWPLKIEKDLRARGLEPAIVIQSETLESQIQNFKTRKIPFHIMLGRLLVLPGLIKPDYFGSIWKSRYAWQAIAKRISNKIFARRPGTKTH